MKRPWNIIDTPVYSLATYDQNKVNMNILTYATAVSLQPKKYAIAVYHGTKTLANLQKYPVAILQFLTTDHLKLVKKLGKKSGFINDKDAFLRNNGFLQKWKRLEVLKGCAAYVKLRKDMFVQTGDHDLYLFDVDGFVSKSDTHQPLMMHHLKSHKIVVI